MTMTEVLVREMADREAIRDLSARYCEALWTGDLDGVADLFIEESTFTVQGVELEVVARGRVEIRRMHQTALAQTKPRMFVHNQIVNLHGQDRAVGRCYVEVRDAKKDMKWVGAGCFKDEYAKENGEWKFAARYHTLDGIDNKVPLRTFIY